MNRKPEELECAKCGAPLDPRQEHAEHHFIECVFCHTQNYVPGYKPKRAQANTITAMPRGAREAFEREMAKRNQQELERAKHAQPQPSPQVEATKRRYGTITTAIGIGLSAPIWIAMLINRQNVLGEAEAARLATTQAQQAIQQATAQAVSQATSGLHFSTRVPPMPVVATEADFAAIDDENIRVLDLSALSPTQVYSADALVEHVRGLARAWSRSSYAVEYRMEPLSLDGTLDLSAPGARFEASFVASRASGAPTLAFVFRNGNMLAMRLTPQSASSARVSAERRATDFQRCPISKALAAANAKRPAPKDARIGAYLIAHSRTSADWYISDDENGWDGDRVSVRNCRAH